jgi:DUF1009 family protein
MSPNDSVGLIAGNGQFPILFAQAAKAQGLRVVAVGMDGETDPSVAGFVDSFSLVKVGQLGKMIKIFQKASISKAAMAGGVRKTRLFGGARPDWTALKLLAQTAVRKDDGMLRAIAREFESKGIEIIDSTLYMPDCLAPEGVLIGNELPEQALNDLHYGYEVARKIGELDIGQTVVVKAGVVIALEAIEGTDACIHRAGELTQKRGAVAVKVAKPNQDMRFDVPAIGVRTIENLSTAGITVLGIEAGRTLMLEPQRIMEKADTLGITIVGLPN